MKKLKNQNGRSMIEMLGVLAIIGVLSVGGIAGYSKAMMKYRINKTIEQITLIAGNVRTFFANQGNYDGLGGLASSCQGDICTTMRNVMIKAKLVPDDMWNSDKTDIENAFGGNMDIQYISKYASISDKKAFIIDLYNIPEEACIELATYDWTVAGAQLISWEYADTGRTKVPLDLEIAIQQCAESHDWFGLLFDVDADSWL